MSKNRYKRALSHLKNKTIDEKLELLSEIPTNHTTGLYVDVPGVDVIPDPVPGPIDSPADYSQDGDGSPGYAGKDTTGLFMEDGTIKTVEPPGDTSYILGPMSSMWYAWANYTQIGYIRQSDRKMVNLGRITGQLDDWDGVSGFTGYGQMTIEQAVWFKGITRVNDYRAFYPGPPSSVADEYGRYVCSITGESKPTQRQPPTNFEPGTQKGGTPDENAALQLAQRQSEGQEEKERREADERNRLILNAVMLGLDVVAVLAVLFPEPASSAAGAAHLATKLRYVAKLRRFRGALNPFGQRAVRSGAAGRVRRQVYSGRPYQGKRGFGKTTYGTTNRSTARTYSNPGPLKGTPGTGSRVNPRGTVDTGTLPQRYIDKYGSRSVLGQKQIKLGRKAAKRTFGEELELLKLLSEAAPTGSGAGGGTEIADAYVDGVSETSSPEQLEQASNTANDIATEGGMGMSASNKAKIDKEAEQEAKRQTNINIKNPESMDSEKLTDSLLLMYESDEQLFEELFNKHEGLIDTVALDKAGKEYDERLEYINTWENYFSLSPTFESAYKESERIWDSFMSRVYTVPQDDDLGFAWRIDGRPITKSEHDLIKKWSAAFTKTWDTYNDVVYPKKELQRKTAYEKYANESNKAHRKHIIAMIRGWNEMFGENDDPFSIKDYINQEGGIQNMSEADKKRLRAYLAKMGLSYGNIASADVMDLGVDATAAILGLGLAGVKLLWDVSTSTATNLINAVSSSDPYGKDQAGPTVTGQPLPGAVDLTPKQQAEVEAAGNEVRDAQRALRDIQDNPNATDSQIEMAQERLDRANKNRTRVRNKNKTDNQNRKESYEPKFLKNIERKNLTEIRTPNQKRILRDIKKPVEVKEMPTKFKVKPTGRKNKSVGVDMMNVPSAPKEFKQPPNMWGKKHYHQNVKDSQERKNQVLELVGAAEHHWTYLTEDRRKKKQEKVNEMMSAEFDKSLELMYENYKKSIDGKSEKLVSKIRTKVKPEYPENPPESLDPKTGMHPKYGKKYKHDKLDPHSAESMPPTGDPVIDANAKKAHDPIQKARKVKNLIGKMKSNS